MQFNFNTFLTFLSELLTTYKEAFTSAEHLSILIINLLLFLNAKKIVSVFENDEKVIYTKSNIFRIFNAIFFIFHLIDIALLKINTDYESILLKIVFSGIILYVFYFIHLLFENFNKKLYGNTTTIDGKKVNLETYASKLINIILDISLGMITLIIIIKYWGLNSLLETTGIVGILLGFLALTANVWAPDILNGLILLNHKLYSEGDIIKYDDGIYIIYKFGYTRVILLKIDNNIRTSIKNTLLVNKTIHNLTKPASSKGMRENLKYNIGYSVDLSLTKEERVLEGKKHKDTVLNMFQEAYKESLEDNNIELNDNINKFEIFMTNAGDYAIEWTIYFYLENPKKTYTTENARQYLNNILYINEKVIEASYKYGIDLSTPILNNITINK